MNNIQNDIRDEDHDCQMQLKGYCRGCETIAEVIEQFDFNPEILKRGLVGKCKIVPFSQKGKASI